MREDLRTYEEEVLIRNKDCDMWGRWRMGAILEAFQEAAVGQCEGLGCGWYALREKHLAWVVVRCEVRMETYPRIGDTVRLLTWPARTRHRFFPRYYEIRNQEGNLIGQGSSLWVLYDLEKREMADPALIAGLVPENMDRKPLMPLPGKIAELPEAGTWEMDYTPLYSHMDANHHVNNTRYADVFCDAIGLQAFEGKRMADMILYYHEQVLPGQKVRLRVRQEGLRYYMAGICGEKTMFEVGCQMAEEE